MDSFKRLGLSDWLIKSLENINVVRASKIQKECIPIILDDVDGKRKNVFACSRTGSGKTLAYVLPILEILVRDPQPYFALILAPTRELAFQINQMIKILAGASKSSNVFMIKSLMVIGGGSFGDGVNEDEAQGLWFGKPNIVVATPGRLVDHLQNRNYLDVCGQKVSLRFNMLVLDEADMLISSSFASQLKAILDSIDEIENQRQTLVFSATLTSALEELKKIVMKRDPSNQPVIINLLPTDDDLKKELATNPDLDQRYILCPAFVKTAYLVECLLDLNFRQLIIFCGTKKEARLIHQILMTLGFAGADFGYNPVLLNADLKQHLRFAALEQFKSLKSRILVTTDLANRGLDIPQVDLVINYSIPKSAINYVHRVGRTCRKPEFDNEIVIEKKDNESSQSSLSLPLVTTAKPRLKPKNRTKASSKYLGKSITFVTQYDIKLLQNIESFIGIKLEKEDGLDEDYVNTILKQVSIAVKDAELLIEEEDYEKNLIEDQKRKNSSEEKVSKFRRKKQTKLPNKKHSVE